MPTTGEDSDPGEWRIVESLILAQAVYKLGDDNWNAVSRVLKSHPLIRRESSEFFSTKNCQSHFFDILSAYLPDEQKTASDMPPIVKLVRKLHVDRINEIKEELKKDEARILTLLREIKESEDSEKKEISQVRTENSDDVGPQEEAFADEDANMERTESMISREDSFYQESEQMIETPAEVEMEVDMDENPEYKDTAAVVAQESESPMENTETNQEEDYSFLSARGSRDTNESVMETDESSDKKKPGRKRKRDTPSNETVDEESNGEDKKKDEKWKNWRKTAMLIWHKLVDHKYGNVFLNSAKQDHIPGYSDAVKKPMTLLTVKNRIRDGDIKTTQELYRDVLLVFTNAIVYNPIDSNIYKMAVEIQASAETEFRNLLSYDRDHLNRRKSLSTGYGTGTESEGGN